MSWRSIPDDVLTARALSFVFQARCLQETGRNGTPADEAAFLDASPKDLTKVRASQASGSLAELKAALAFLDSPFLDEFIKSHEPSKNLWDAWSKTNVPWGPRRSSLIGVSALFFLLPWCVDGRFIWALQAWICFHSDYLDSGRHSASHAFDRILAHLLVGAVLFVGLRHLGVLYVVVLSTPTFFFFSRSGRRRRAGDFHGYARYHFLWHLAAGSSAALTLYLL